ncbi:pyridoxal phosphate-dependent transferase [Massariosphaeria phaeospora]|uniref:Pyridoxal phosphate-dependent transferase n=1 Tax=Massariosphaeria phaeospora TaxID=100035 RepID=A0A7C8MJD4_9PLEO|nr:pyridoxal phosphate-dependent transferase [Massariosphaeria phaeospora]
MSEFASYIGKGTKPSSNGSAPNEIAWGSQSNPAAFDFRSDVTTTPTASMLNAIAHCTLLDDIMVEDPTTIELERFIAELTGKEDALLVLSGTMGNGVALRTHLVAPPQAIVCDRRSHIIQYEAGGPATMSQALTQTIDAKNGTYITLEEVKQYSVISDDIHACPTRVVSLENTLNGAIMPLAEVKRISSWARSNGILLHMDGARLWEAVAAGAGTLKEYCAEMDSVSLCFSKGLGAPIGSIVVGSKPFIKRARWVRKSMGGGLRQAGVVAAPARVAVEETFLGGKLTQSHETAKRIEKIWADLGGKLKYPVDTNMVWLDIEANGIELDRFIELGERYGVRLFGGRLVVHYQIGEEAVERLGQVFGEVLTGEEGSKRGGVDVAVEALKMEGKMVE